MFVHVYKIQLCTDLHSTPSIFDCSVGGSHNFRTLKYRKVMNNKFEICNCNLRLNLPKPNRTKPKPQINNNNNQTQNQMANRPVCRRGLVSSGTVLTSASISVVTSVNSDCLSFMNQIKANTWIIEGSTGRSNVTGSLFDYERQTASCFFFTSI